MITLTRRHMLSTLAASPLILGPAGAARAKVADVTWATWESNGKAEYTNTFEGKTGVKVRRSFLTSEDAQFAALKSGAGVDWDFLNPSLNGSSRYVKGGVLKALDLAKVPNAARMYDAFQGQDRIKGADGRTYMIPYLWGLNPIVYRADRHEKEPDYSTLFDPKYKGQLAMRDYALEAIAIAGLHMGIDRAKVFTMSGSELAEAKKVLVAQKPLLRTYWQSIGDLTNLFATGEVTCAFSWRVPYDVLKDTMKMGMAKPAAGIMGWCDCFAMPAGISDERAEIGLAFADYLLGPDYGLAVARGGNYATTTPVIRDQLTPAEQASIFVNDMGIMKDFLWPVAPPNYADWLKAWNEVKAS